MRRTAVLVLVVLLLIATLVVVFLNDGAQGPVDDVQPDPETPATIEPGLEARGTAPPEAEATPKPERIGVMVGRESEHIRGMAATIRCRVVLEGAVAGAPKTGRVKLVAWEPDNRGGAIHECDVVDGAFSVVMRPEHRIGIRSMTLDGIPAVEVGVEPGTKHLVSADVELVIKARHVHRTTLRVVSEATGQELGGVQVVDGSKARSQGHEHPGRYPEDAVLVTGATSPVKLAAPSERDVRRGFQRLFVRADGHAWQQVRVDPLTETVQTVRLPAGGDVVVRLEPGVDRTGLFVKIAWGDSKIIHSAVVPADQPTRIESVAVGERRIVLAAPGDVLSAPKSVASAVVNVVADDTTEVVLRPSAPERTVAFSGSLEFSRTWGVNEMSVIVTRVNPAKRTKERGRKVKLDRTSTASGPRRTFTWDAGPVVPGVYTVGVVGAHWAGEIEVPEAGSTGVFLTVPDPVDVTVRLSSKEAGLPEERVLRWQALNPAMRYGGPLTRAELDPNTGAYRFRVPAGEVQLSLSDFTVEIVDPVFDVSGPAASRDVEVRARSGFVIVLMDGDDVLKWIGPWFDRATRVGDPSVRHTGWSSNQRGKLVMVPEPGRYLVELNEIPGYEPVGERTVDVRKGAFVELVVPLVRAR